MDLVSNYVLFGAPGDDTALTRVLLVAKTSNEVAIPNQPAPVPQPGMAQVNSPPQQPQETPPDPNDQPTADENNAVDNNADQPPPESAEQAPDQAPNPDQPQVKTPQQMLQEMQQPNAATAGASRAGATWVRHAASSARGAVSENSDVERFCGILGLAALGVHPSGPSRPQRLANHLPLSPFAAEPSLAPPQFPRCRVKHDGSVPPANGPRAAAAPAAVGHHSARTFSAVTPT